METDDGSAEIKHGYKGSTPTFALLSFGIIPLNVKCGCFSDKTELRKKNYLLFDFCGAEFGDPVNITE
jgi:hypothetical protein